MPRRPSELETPAPAQVPVRPAPVPPLPVHWAKLYGDYDADPAGAGGAYRGKRVRVALRADSIREVNGGIVLGHGGELPSDAFQPVILARFRDPADAAGMNEVDRPWVVVEGVVAGRVDDGLYRGRDRKPFRVDLTGCVKISVSNQAPSTPN